MILRKPGSRPLTRAAPNPQPRGSCADDVSVDDDIEMEAVISSPHGKGLDRLLAHCAGLDRLLADEQDPPAFERLEALVGRDLARTLVFALGIDSPGASARDQRFAA